MTNEEIMLELNGMSGMNPEFYNNIIPNCKPPLGIRVPNLRDLAKRIARDDYKTFLDTFPLDYLESELLHVMVIGYLKAPIDVVLYYFEDYIPKIHDWCVNDTLCQGMKIAKKYPKEVWDVLMKYKKTKKEFVSRIISVMLTSHYLTDEYITKVIKVINNLNIDEYNAKMGVAWCIATLIGKYPDLGLDYMKSEDNKLDKWTYNKAIQKSIESYRVSEEIKNELKKLRK